MAGGASAAPRAAGALALAAAAALVLLLLLPEAARAQGDSGTNDDQDKLLAFQASFINGATTLANWTYSVGNGTAPCGSPPWFGIRCAGGRVTGM